MANALIHQERPIASAIEQVVITGDLKALTSAQRVEYYNRVCQSVGLNPFTRPFDYITLNGKLTLYARRDAADQLRSLHGISLGKPHIEYTDDMVIVTVEATDKEGRNDTDLGAVSLKSLQGEARANAIMKAITKAKRRVTLSLAGLGWLDETEVDTIPGAQHVKVDSETGEIIDPALESGESKKPILASADDLQRLDEIGLEYYKAKWPANQKKWAEWASTGTVSTFEELQPQEVDAIIDAIGKRIAERVSGETVAGK